MQRRYERLSPVEKGTLLATLSLADRPNIPSNPAAPELTEPIPMTIGELALQAGELQDAELTADLEN